MEYKSIFLTSNIRPRQVMIALKDLCASSLYMKEGIVINSDWEKTFNESKQNHDNDLFDIKCSNSSTKKDEPEATSETLVHGCEQAHLIHDLCSRIIQLAPCEGFKPL